MTIIAHKTASENSLFQGFTFTGKERDEETGYGYFGARYMDHELMTMWLSVDPMSDKYLSISPYAYCAWNPIKLVDPNGMVVDSNYVPSFVKRVLDQSDKKYNPAFAQKYKELDDDPITIYRFFYNKKNDTGGRIAYGGKDESRDIINIYFSKGHSLRAEDGCLLEETYHAYQFLIGDFGFLLDEKGFFLSMLAYDQNDEVEAKCFAAENTLLKTSFEKGLLKAANSNDDKVGAVWKFLSNRPSVEFDEYKDCTPGKYSMDYYTDVLFHPDGTAYHPKYNIVGRKPRRK